MLIEDVKSLFEFHDRCYKKFKKILKDNSDPNKDLNEEVTTLESVFVNIIISYARCFDTSKNKEGKQSRRLIKLNRHFIRNIDKSGLEIHNMLMNLRDSRVAHAGVTHLENYAFKIGVDIEGRLNFGHGGDIFKAFITENIDNDKVKILMDGILNEINRKMDVLIVIANEELKILYNKPSLLANKLLTGQPIVDSDLR